MVVDFCARPQRWNLVVPLLLLLLQGTISGVESKVFPHKYGCTLLATGCEHPDPHYTWWASQSSTTVWGDMQQYCELTRTGRADSRWAQIYMPQHKSLAGHRRSYSSTRIVLPSPPPPPPPPPVNTQAKTALLRRPSGRLQACNVHIATEMGGALLPGVHYLRHHARALHWRGQRAARPRVQALYRQRPLYFCNRRISTREDDNLIFE